MGDKKSQFEGNQRQKPMSLIGLSMVIGLFGGIFWSAIGYLAYVFHFTVISPNVILEPWTIGAWKDSWLGTVFAILFIGLVGIGAALLYYFTLRKFKSLFVGVVYGIALFLLVFLVLNPIFPGISSFSKLDQNTIVTSVCLYILFGAFVGYSISYEESEIKKLHEAKNQKEVQTS